MNSEHKPTSEMKAEHPPVSEDTICSMKTTIIIIIAIITGFYCFCSSLEFTSVVKDKQPAVIVWNGVRHICNVEPELFETNITVKAHGLKMCILMNEDEHCIIIRTPGLYYLVQIPLFVAQWVSSIYRLFASHGWILGQIPSVVTKCLASVNGLLTSRGYDSDMTTVIIGLLTMFIPLISWVFIRFVFGIIRKVVIGVLVVVLVIGILAFIFLHYKQELMKFFL